jgi:hypothetical protein
LADSLSSQLGQKRPYFYPASEGTRIEYTRNGNESLTQCLERADRVGDCPREKVILDLEETHLG